MAKLARLAVSSIAEGLPMVVLEAWSLRLPVLGPAGEARAKCNVSNVPNLSELELRGRLGDGMRKAA